MKALTARGISVLLTIAAGGLFLIAPTGSWAQQKLKYSFKDPGGLTKYTQQHVLDVGDVAGHHQRQWHHGFEDWNNGQPFRRRILVREVSDQVPNHVIERTHDGGARWRASSG